MLKTIAVSGSGTGIGRAIARELAAQNVQVILVGRTRSKLEETRASLANPDFHRVLAVDIRDARSLCSGLQALKSPYLTAVVANAGVGGENHYGLEDRWSEIVETNLTGTYQFVNEALPYLRSHRSPGDLRQIIVISSILARLGVPGYSAYCASKAGLLGLVRSWAAEFSSESILVNAICPGWVETDMAVQGLESFAKNANTTYEAVFREQMAQVPLGKMAQPEEVAKLVVFLVLGGQSSITGQTLDMNNGALMP